jgi:hypothetical protein
MRRVAAVLLIAALLFQSLGLSTASAQYDYAPGYSLDYLGVGYAGYGSPSSVSDSSYLGYGYGWPSWGFGWFWPPFWPGFGWPGWPGWPGWGWPRPPRPGPPCILIYPPPPGC